VNGVSINVSGNIAVPTNGIVVLETIPGAIPTINITIDEGASVIVGGTGVLIGETTPDSTSTMVVTLDNAGVIQTTGTAQGVDCSELISPFQSISIINEATGTIQSADADAILAGENETIDNSGQIIALSVGTPSSDGIDFQDTNNGVVNNAVGALIEGAEDGIFGK
jgi:hypothetical protein